MPSIQFLASPVAPEGSWRRAKFRPVNKNEGCRRRLGKKPTKKPTIITSTTLKKRGLGKKQTIKLSLHGFNLIFYFETTLCFQ